MRSVTIIKALFTGGIRKRTSSLSMIVFLAMLPTVVFAGVSDREVAVGDLLPAQVLELKDGNRFNVPSGEGVTVVLFWATWSPRSAPALELWHRFSAAYPDEPLRVVTVNSEKDGLGSTDRAAIDSYVEENGVTLPVHIDEGLVLFNTYAVKAVPTVFFLDRIGKVLYRYAGFPTSAPLDLQEELEIRLGLRKRQTDQEAASRGKLAYQPKNNGLLYYNMAVQLKKKGFPMKARQRLLKALERDPEYLDPLLALEEDFFAEGRTPDSEKALGVFLLDNGFTELSKRYSGGR
ncbi:MAG: redoxin family protein [bacterium]|nr:redoxin family protein [bacterium]MDT8394831.1 redoxin family protein [bacterium]